MPTYVEKVTSSDLSPSWGNTTWFDNEMSAGTGTDTSVSRSFATSELRSASFITVSGKPNNDSWEDGGTQTVELEIITGNMNLRGRCRIVSLNSSGTILQSGSFTGFQTLQAATISYSPVAPTWSHTEDCDNRLAIEFEFENTDTMMAQTLEIGLGTTANEVITDITEDSGTCGGAPTRTLYSGPIPQPVI